MILEANRHSWPLRRKGLEDFTIRVRPLIESIKQYEQMEGRPPSSIEEVKAAGLIKDSGFEINDGRKVSYKLLRNAPTDIQKDHSNQPWMLTVPASWVFKYDYMFYYPLEEYPEGNASGRIERIRDWAYVHE